MAMTVKEAGRRGGKARARKLSQKRIIEIAKLGYAASPLSTKHANSKQTDKTSQNKV